MGSALPLNTLKPHYDAILFAYGASKDKSLGIPGEKDIKGIYSARAFVGWYNGLPEYRDLAPDLTSGEDAVVIGQGNVAMDVARALLTSVDVLKKTDMADYAVAELAKSKIKRVRVVGRRGPMQVHLFLSVLIQVVSFPESIADHDRLLLQSKKFERSSNFHLWPLSQFRNTFSPLNLSSLICRGPRSV